MQQVRPTISVIIVCYNCEKFVERCLQSILKNKLSFEVIMVDNASTDETVSLLFAYTEVYNNFFLLRNRENVGFAKAINQGVAKAKGEYVVLVNPDTGFGVDVLERLVVFAEKRIGSFGICGPVVVDMKTKRKSGGAFLTLTGFFIYPKQIQSTAYQVSAVSGAFLLMKRAGFLKLGGFDEAFFMYSEDADLCMRSLLSGGEVWVDPSIVVYHATGSSSRKLRPEFIVFHSFKNRIQLLLKNFCFPVLWLLLPIHLFFLLLGCLGFALLGKFSEAWAVIRAVIWNISHLRFLSVKRHVVFAGQYGNQWKILKKMHIFPFRMIVDEGLAYLDQW